MTGQERLKNWLKDPQNVLFLGILISAIIIRLYYFWMTKNQPLWWDESSYMAAAKNYAGIGFYGLESIRLPGFPLLMSLFFFLGITSEPVMRFIALLIPSIIVIFLTYFMIKEMYPDKKIALISVAILSVLWEHLFYSNRFHTENFSLIFQFFAIFILFVCYIKKKDFSFIKSKYSLLWIFVLSLISVFFRSGNLVFIPGLLLFLVIFNKSKIFTKKNSIFVLLALAILIGGAIFILNMPRTGILYSLNTKNPLAWNVFNVFSGFYESPVNWLPPILFYAFILGIFLVLIQFYIMFPKLKILNSDDQDLDLKSDVFNILNLLSVLLFFLLIIRPFESFEYRWFFPLLPGMLAFTSKGVISFSSFIGDILKNKKISTLLIILITLAGIYTQAVHADSIIKIRLNSYSHVKEAGLWIKENSNSGDLVITESQPQISYYSERKTHSWAWFNESLSKDTADKSRIRYLVLSAFESHPSWAYAWPQQHSDMAIPVNAYFLDQEQKQPALVIYELKNYSF